MIQHLFTCAICGHEVRDYADRNGRDRALSPICRYCERRYADRGPTAGAFMDRRVACRLSAIANALRGAATMKEWEIKHGIA